MGRDVADLWSIGSARPLVVLFFALPLASLVLLLMRRWLALFPLAISLSLFALWFLYYATDWFNPVSGGSGAVVFAVVLIGWLGVWAAIFVPRMHRRARARSHRSAV